MAWGLWNKIKKGFKKVGSAFKKAGQWVNNKVIKPFKPIIKGAVNAILPGAGAVVDAASGGIDALTNGDLSGVSQSAKDVAAWARANLK